KNVEERAGLRPFGNGLERRFDFEPVPYDARSSERKRACIQNMHNALAELKYCFWGEVAVSWTMYFDEQRRLESDGEADLDNYAKLLNDSIVGPNGVLIDDSQIQSLHIYWIDTRGRP